MAELRTIGGKMTMDVTDYVDGTTKARTVTRTFTEQTAATREQLDRLKEKYREQGVEIELAVDKSKSMVQQVKRELREQKNAERQYQRVIREYKNLSSQVGKNAQDQQVLNALHRLGANATLTQRKEIVKLVREHQKLVAASGQTQGSFRNLRGITQNLGWQLQDTAVQAQMGTDALIILGQQGSQMAAAFGATGALVGAGIAVVSMLASVAKASGEAVEEFDDVIEKFKEMSDLGRQVETQKRQAEINKLLKDREDVLGRINDFDISTIGGGSGSELASAIGAMEGEAESLLEKVNELSEQLNELFEAALPTDDQMTDPETAIGELNDALREEIKLLGKSARQVELYEAAKIGAGKETVDLINKKYDEIEAEEKYKEALASARRANQERLNDQKRLATEAKRVQESIDKQIEALERQAYGYGKTKEEVKRYSLVQEGATKDQLARADAAIAKINEEIAAEQRKARVLAEINAEATARRSRTSKLDSFESGLDAGKTAIELEIQKFEQNSMMLRQMKSELNSWEYQEAARINQMLELEEQRHVDVMNDIDKQREISQLQLNQAMMNNATQGVANLGDVAEEGTALAKAAFVAQQLQAAASVMVNAETAKWSLNKTAMTPAQIAINEGLIQANKTISLGVIAGATFAGAFDKGGRIGEDQWGIAAEYGPELVNGALVMGAANVTSSKDTAKLLEQRETNVTISPTVVVKEGSQESAMQLSNQIYSRLLNDVRNNGVFMREVRGRL